jgi:hypothetical protein
MNLKPQDVFITLKLVALGKQPWTYAQLASELHMSASEINGGVKRAIRARLVAPAAGRGGNPRPIIMALEEFLIHGVKYAFPPNRGTMTLGVATSYAGPPMRDMVQPHEELPPIWPDPKGETKGIAFEPLYKSVSKAAMADPKLYELLSLVDTIRDERARERNLAARELSTRLKEWAGSL